MIDRGTRQQRGALYLYVLAVLGPVTLAVRDLLPEDANLAGLSFTGLAQWGLVLAALLLWPLSGRRTRADAALFAFLAALLAAWLVYVVHGAVRGEFIHPLAAVLPVILVLIVTKPPAYRDAVTSLSLFMWSLVIVLWCSLVVDLIARDSRIPPAELQVSVPCRVPDWVLGLWEQPVAARLEIWSWIGLPGRWSGVAGNPNGLAPLAAAMLVYGLTRRGMSRIFLVLSGSFFLLLTGSRTSILAAIAGVLVLVIAAPRGRWVPFSRAARAWGAAIGAGVVVVLAVVQDPDLNGRTTMWRVFGKMWTEAPLTGIGAQGFEQAVRSCAMPPSEINAGSQLIDALVRFGILGVVALGFTYVVGLVITGGAARRHQSAPLALLTVLVVGGLADLPLEWGWPSAAWLGMLLLPVLLAWSWNTERRGDRVAGRSEELATPSE